MAEIVKITGHEIELSHLDKILFPKSEITKGDLINYYKDIAKKALPYYKNRPLTMERAPNGIQKESFIQKEIPDYFPKWIERTKLSKKDGQIEHVLVNNAATLVYVANQACITFHLTLSRADKIHYPSYLIFDLDPSTEDVPLLKEVAKQVNALMEDLGLKGFLQTTGSRGFHIYVPLKRDLTFEKVRGFAKKCAGYLALKYPEEMTIEQSKEKRGKRVLIDYMRNAYGNSAVAPYSVRTKENAPIATPLHWEELENKDLDAQSYHIKNIFKRLSQVKDPWVDMAKHKFSLGKSEELLEKMMKPK